MVLRRQFWSAVALLNSSSCGGPAVSIWASSRGSLATQIFRCLITSLARCPTAECLIGLLCASHINVVGVLRLLLAARFSLKSEIRLGSALITDLKASISLSEFDKQPILTKARSLKQRASIRSTCKVETHLSEE